MKIWFDGLGALVTAYIVGSLPTGYIVARLWGINDIRDHGSGNIGATNVARIIGKQFFIPVFLGDAIKAALYLMVFKAYGWSEMSILAMACALLLGNGYSVFLQFTGGKGFATTTGIIWVLYPSLLCVLVPIWVITVSFTQTVGIASAVTCVCLALSSWFITASDYMLLAFIFMGVWGVVRHHDNIRRYAFSKGWLA